ncbi:MAG: hypothetical protein SW019_10455 [Actinomycetota bacterium]|nr:hypothetical protein [Actinomycetota bacterium]
MPNDLMNEAVVAAIKDTAVPHVDRNKILELYGNEPGTDLADRVAALVKEAASMPIEWGQMTLAEGVQDILDRFSTLHPELSHEALREIGRCVGWQLR